MSHSFELENYTFISDSDIEESMVLIKREYPDQEFKVPGRYLMQFVADYVRRRRIDQLEDMSTNFDLERILGIK